jgi:GntR family transcriptional regulator / MocR family aminotransferase
MTPWKELLPIDKTSTTPIYLQITNAVIHNIRRGQLRKGTRLPGARELASALNIHRKTLQTAYDELMAQGWIEIVPRRGAFVVNELPEIKPMKISTAQKLGSYPDKTSFPIDEKRLVQFPHSSLQGAGNMVLDDGLPDIRLAPTEELMREYRSLSNRNAFKKYFRYGGPRGAAYLLDTLSTFLSETRGLPISSSNLLITRGAQMAFYLATRLLLKPGDHVIVGEPGYFIANLTFRQAGAVVHRVPVDDSGIDVDSIESLCLKKKLKLVYVIPHHHYPTTVTLTPERRIRLLELAARHKFAIIEDDYDYDFDYSSAPILPMASLDHHGNVIYVGTLTKTLVPAIRIGFMVAPENFIDAASQLRRGIDWQGDSMMEVAIAELYKNGAITRHIKKSVKLYRERRDSLCAELKDKLGRYVSFKVPDGGMAVWAEFNGVDLKQVAAKAAKNGLTMGDGTLFNTGAKNYNSTRLGFASLNFKEQEKAVEILKEVL